MNSAIRKASVSPKSMPCQIGRQLLFSRVLIAEVSSSLKESNPSLTKKRHRGPAGKPFVAKFNRRYICSIL